MPNAQMLQVRHLPSCAVASTANKLPNYRQWDQHLGTRDTRDTIAGVPPRHESGPWPHPTQAEATSASSLPLMRKFGQAGLACVRSLRTSPTSADGYRLADDDGGVSIRDAVRPAPRAGLAPPLPPGEGSGGEGTAGARQPTSSASLDHSLRPNPHPPAGTLSRGERDSIPANRGKREQRDAACAGTELRSLPRGCENAGTGPAFPEDAAGGRLSA
jgi:hypothetical protein